MARYKSMERQLAERVVDRAFSGFKNNRTTRNTNSKSANVMSGKLAFLPVLLLCGICGWTQCNPQSGLIEPSGTNATSASSDFSDKQFGVAQSEAQYFPQTSFETDEYPEKQSSALTEVLVQNEVPAVDGERVTIERAVDGDTLIVHSSNGRERVRLIGANTPETVKRNWPIEPFGPEASAYTKQRIEEANYVATLVSDGDKTDRYGRRLAFVYLGNDTISLNEELVRIGLAEAQLQYRYSKEMKARLAQAEEEARTDNLGIHTLAQ